MNRKNPIQRALKVMHWFAYITLVIFAFVCGQGHAAWGYTDPVSGQFISYPAIPFQWHTTFMVFAVGTIVIELLRAVILYIVTGKSVRETVEETF